MNRRRLALVATTLSLLAVACTPPPNGGGGGEPSAPVARASTAASAGPAPFTVSFYSDGSYDLDGEIVSYEWAFGDGTTSTQVNPVRSFASVGTYTATLTVTDDDGLSTESAPVEVTAFAPGDATDLILLSQPVRAVGLGTDRIGVWVCDVAGSTGPVHDPSEVAAWAQGHADEYFTPVSMGRYEADFTPLGTFPVDDAADCLDEGRARTGSPYTNAMVVDTTDVGGGLGSSGYVYASGTGGAPGEPPSASLRGFIVGGGSYSSFPNEFVLLHEIGHSLHWPHSFLSPSNEYDNPVDLMSGYTGPQSCSVPGWIYHCRPQHTLAFNRWTSGWVDPDQVVLHTGGSRQVDLSRPGLNGSQLVVAPSNTSSRAMLTVEARPTVGFDEILDVGGVAVHVVDQRPAACSVGGSFGGCPSLWRRQGQAWGPPDSYSHVLQPGQSRMVHGVTVTVEVAIADGYRVTISGVPSIPAGVLPVAPALRAPVELGPGGGIRTTLAAGG